VANERILVVDDEPGVRAALEGILADEGFRVLGVATGEAGLEALSREAFDAVLLDVWLPGLDGLETLERLRERHVDVEVVMISGHGTIDTAVRATKLGAFDFVEKPLSLERTLLVLRNALRQRRLERRNRQLLEQLGRETEIAGRSASADRLRRELEAAAGSTAPVLICGEPGTGREAVARRIHARGAAPDGPFVELPCAALDAEAAQAALSGQRGERGRLELAAGGTLFLANVDHLGRGLQRKLAETLREQAKQAAPARPMASAGPEPAAVEGSLRQVLQVISIAVPALRERREDIPLLAEGFMSDLAREYGRSPKRFSPDSLAALKAHHWPGNVRELRNVVERLLLFTAGEIIEAQDLPDRLGGARPPAEDLYREFASLAEGVRAFERYYISRALSRENGNHEAAAARLGLSPEALRERLELLP
jgi:two-component system nitrogen regulation response regulator NtrX